MTSYKKVLEQADRFMNKLVQFTGVNKPLVANIVQFAKCMIKPGTSGKIDDLIFIAVLDKFFNISSSWTTSLMYEAARSNPDDGKLLSWEDCTRFFCVLLSKRMDIKVDYVFKVYDINKDGVISWSEIYNLLQESLVTEGVDEEEAEETLKDLIDLVLNTVDEDKNGSIELSEFRALVKRDILYLEILGPCLPSERIANRFVDLISDKTTLQIKEMFEHVRFECLCEHARTERDNLMPIMLDLP